MKILFVLDTFYPKIDGPATVINNIASIIMKSKNNIVDILVPKYPKYQDKFTYKVIRCNSIIGPDGYRTPLPQFSFNFVFKSICSKENKNIMCW